MMEYTKSSTDQIIATADRFLSVEAMLMEENDPLEMTLQKERKIVKFNNYSTDVLVRLIKVDLDTSNFNCDKFDFTS